MLGGTCFAIVGGDAGCEWTVEPATQASRTMLSKKATNFMAFPQACR